MRDNFNDYFAGWNLDPEEPKEAQAEFAQLVSAVGAYLAQDAKASDAWRVFPLDGKKECFFHFVKMARDAGALPASVAPLLARLKADYPRSFG
jgi:hypothetical protein